MAGAAHRKGGKGKCKGGGGGKARNSLELHEQHAELERAADRGDVAAIRRLAAAGVCRVPHSDEKVAIRDVRGFGWEIAHAAGSPTPADFALHDGSPYRGDAYDNGVWDSSIVQGPFSIAPCQTLASRFAAFAYQPRGRNQASKLGDGRCGLGRHWRQRPHRARPRMRQRARRCRGGAALLEQRFAFLGDAKNSLGDAKSSLCDAQVGFAVGLLGPWCAQRTSLSS